jgi:hypothetical protein
MTSAATRCLLGAATMANDAAHWHPRAPTTSLRATIVVASTDTRRLSVAARTPPGPRATALTPTLVLNCPPHAMTTAASHGGPYCDARNTTTAGTPRRRAPRLMSCAQHEVPRLPTHAPPLTTAMAPSRRDLLYEPVANHHLPRTVVTRARDGHRGRCGTTRRHTVKDPVTAATMLHAPTNDPRRSPPAVNTETTRT